MAAGTGATRNQVVLSWIAGGAVAPIVGVTTAERITEAMGARDVVLTAEQRTRLDLAC